MISLHIKKEILKISFLLTRIEIEILLDLFDNTFNNNLIKN